MWFQFSFWFSYHKKHQWDFLLRNAGREAKLKEVKPLLKMPLIILKFFLFPSQSLKDWDGSSKCTWKFALGEVSGISKLFAQRFHFVSLKYCMQISWRLGVGLLHNQYCSAQKQHRATSFSAIIYNLVTWGILIFLQGCQVLGSTNLAQDESAQLTGPKST